MAMVVMGLFDDPKSAQEALRALEAEGFARENIDVRSGDTLMEQIKTDRGDTARDNQDEEGIWARIRHFFQDIGSKKDASTRRSSERESSSETAAANPRDINESDVLIIVNASDDMAEQAADIMEEYGGSDESVGPGDVRVYSVVVESVVEAAAPPADESIGRPGVALLSPEEERQLAAYEREFSDDWQARRAGSTGLSPDQVLPGYEYGYRLGRTPQFSDTEWSTIEPQVRRNWDERRLGPWDRLKEVVRSGWDRAHRHG